MSSSIDNSGPLVPVLTARSTAGFIGDESSTDHSLSPPAQPSTG